MEHTKQNWLKQCKCCTARSVTLRHMHSSPTRRERLTTSTWVVNLKQHQNKTKSSDFYLNEMCATVARSTRKKKSEKPKSQLWFPSLIRSVKTSTFDMFHFDGGESVSSKHVRFNRLNKKHTNWINRLHSTRACSFETNDNQIHIRSRTHSRHLKRLARLNV